MESDSDSDGSHISATPPRDNTPPPPPPPPPHHILSSRQSSVRVSSTPLLISKPKPPPSKPKPKPKPKPNPSPKPSTQEASAPPFPSVDLSNLPGFSVRIQRLSGGDNAVLSSASSTSFASLVKSRRSSFDPLDFERDEAKVVDRSGEGCENVVEEAATKATDSVPRRKMGTCSAVLKTLPNWIGDIAREPMEEPKRLKFSNEGNFVRLNINGYGRKYAFRNGKKRGSTSSRYSRYRRRWSKSKPRTDAGAGAGNGLPEEDDFVSDTMLKQREKNCDWGAVEEAVAIAREDPSDQNLEKLLKLTHGYDSFRDGQLEAIKRVVARQSTMLVLPTGAGKSLCYQLPALILPGLTLVVSPLVALMVDQLHKLPPTIPGGILCSSQTREAVIETLDRVREGCKKVLYVSPERFSNAEFLSVFDNAPPISLVVVDEAHCLSEWSHNFRPSYLRLRASMLRNLLHAECFLAMTATATTQTLHGIMSALEIEPSNLIQTCQIRGNLQLHVTRSENRLKDLLLLLKSSPLNEFKSIIVYCKFQSETDTISKFLRDNKIPSKGYHGGMQAKDRSHIQEQFCSNKIKVVVATVAFGMGLDKSDIGAVIHYSLPVSMEEYVQETGRAGRDGRLSHCHLLLDDSTYFKLRSFLYSDGTDEYAINRFLGEIFENSMNIPGKICSLVRESASWRFDMKEEVMLTILTQLELGEVQYLILEPPLNVTCTMYFHKTSPTLLANKDALVAAILEKSEMKQGHYMFDIPTVANISHTEVSELLSHLQNLKFIGEITYDLKDPAFSYRILKKPDDICSLSAHIARWLFDVQTSKVWKLDAMFNLATYAIKECKRTDGCSGSLHTMCIQKKLLDYFSREHDITQSDFLAETKSSPFLRADIKVFLQGNSFTKFTPRAVARIMHGIPSPVFPSANWSKSHFWGRYSQVDFSVVMEAARAELMNFVGKGEV